MLRKQAVQLMVLVTCIAFCASIALARKFTLTASTKVPSASGEINAKMGNNNNTEVDLTVRNLAKPGDLTPAANSYVVWFEEQGAPPQNMGELKVDGKLKGQLKTVTPWKNFDVFITPETDPMVKEPTGEAVLRTKVQES